MPKKRSVKVFNCKISDPDIQGLYQLYQVLRTAAECEREHKHLVTHEYYNNEAGRLITQIREIT